MAMATLVAVTLTLVALVAITAADQGKEAGRTEPTSLTTTSSAQPGSRRTELLLPDSPVATASKKSPEWRTPMKPMMTSSIPLPIEGDLPSLEGSVEWINSPALTPASLRGKVVLIDIWNYSCINWRQSSILRHQSNNQERKEPRNLAEVFGEQTAAPPVGVVHA